MQLTFIVKYASHWGELLRMKRWQLAITGNQSLLGNWNPDNAVLLQNELFQSWKAEIETDIIFPLEYKYIILDEHNNLIAWETGFNRIISGVDSHKPSDFIDKNLHFDLAPFRGAGVAIPVFSLRSEKSFGIGEFLDLKKLVDWAALTGQHIIQTLPVNDTSLTGSIADSYPYNTLSVFALHPIYLNLEAIGKLTDKKQQQYFAKKQKELNKRPKVDYEKVYQLKNDYFRLIFEQEKENTLSLKEYKNFIKQNKEYLLPYAVYCCLRDKYKTTDFSKWEDFAVFIPKKINDFATKNNDDVSFYLFLQYHLHKQLSEAHAYAKEKGIMLKGDIPIGVSPCSVDVWSNPKQFNTNQQAGAPPDDFSERGQNWGFPTYNWDAMATDNFRWWKNRLKYMSQYFDAYRIDHILGFFRIWQVPMQQKWGLLGQFNPALPFSESGIESYGLNLSQQQRTGVFISEDIVSKYFGEKANFVKKEFLQKQKNGTYLPKKGYETQVEILTYFSEKKKLSAEEIELREGLLKMLCNVLFVEDDKQKGFYHPRISCHLNEAFGALTEKEKENYTRLYNDFFFHRHNEFWKHQALHKLPHLLSATAMLACGEDLGMIPACVPEVMGELNLLSLEIQRMPKEFGVEFGDPAGAPYLSVCTTSTHDMSPLRQWWEEDYEKSQRYYNYILHLEGNAPKTCKTFIAEKILKQHLQSPAEWVIFPLQDWMAIDESIRNPDAQAERINVPDNPNNEWNYRMHTSLESLLKATIFNQKIASLVALRN
jgi:4-alpha-glucanotransferase